MILGQLLFNKVCYWRKGAKFGLLSRIAKGTVFEGNNRVGKFTYFSGKMGRWSYIGDNSFLMGSIGKFCSISSNVRVINGRHAMCSPYVSTSPLFFSKSTPFGKSFIQEQTFEEYKFSDSERRYPIMIGNDCWIGYGASIIEGVVINDGAVVLANATVTKDVPPYAIVGGVPAKIIGFRYDEQTIKHLMEIKWWERDDQWLREKVGLFNDIQSFQNQV